MKKIFRVFCIVVACSVLLCCCKKDNKEDASSENLSTAITDTPLEDGKEDPQISVDDRENGTKVEEFIKKEGKQNGIDVSKWQEKINWKSVKATGVDFAIIRIGYRGENGTIYKDDCADYNIQQAVKNDILVGVYFFSTAVNTAEAIEEASWTANAIKSYPISYPVVYDCEGFMNPESRMYSLSNSQRTDNALVFLGEIEKSGYDGMFYAAKKEMENSLRWDISRIESLYKIWVAHYPLVTYPNIANPDYSGKYDMWQYTNMGKVNGIKGNADMVVSYFTATKAEPKSNIAVPEAAAPVEKDNIYTAVNDTVTAKEEVNLRDSASTSGNIVGKLLNGETIQRSATGSNGWSKLIYNGKTVYAVTSYLTTDLSYTAAVSEPDDPFKPVNEQVTAKDETNLRSVAGSKSADTIVYTLKNGEIALRIGIADNGWSKVEYGGQVLYAISSYLTTDLNYKPPVSEPQQTQESGMQFTEVNEQVTAKSETNLRSVPSSADSSTIVYTLKNGEYVTRTGISDKGWSRLQYNGQTVYAISSFLTK